MDKNHDNESGAIEILKQDLFKLDNEYRYVCVSIMKYVDKLTYPYSAGVCIEVTCVHVTGVLECAVWQRDTRCSIM